MSPKTPEQFNDVREQKKALIMETAMELFANKGYYTTSINQIAETAGIAKGLLYNYFISKEDLLTSIIENGLNELANTFDKNHDGVLTDEEFIFFLDANFKTLQENRTYWMLLFSLMLQPQVQKIVMPKYQSVINQFIGILEKYFESKGFENPKMTALAFGAFMDGIGINFMMNPDIFPVEDVKEYITTTYMRIIK